MPRSLLRGSLLFGFLRLGNASRDRRARTADGKQGFPEASHSDSPTTMLHPMLRREMRECHRTFKFPSPQTLKSYFKPHFAPPFLHCSDSLLLFSPQEAGSRALAKLGGSSSREEASRMGYDHGESGEGSLCCRVVRSYTSVRRKRRIPHLQSDLRLGVIGP